MKGSPVFGTNPPALIFGQAARSCVELGCSRLIIITASEVQPDAAAPVKLLGDLVTSQEIISSMVSPDTSSY